MGTKEMSIKLMIDPETNRLIFAEASNDFVDFLIYLLSLPIATVTNLLSEGSMVGSIAKVHSSFELLHQTCLMPNIDKLDILYPSVFPSIKTPLSLNGSSRMFYTCSNPECERAITNAGSVQCPGCNLYMYKGIEFIDKDSGEGYVRSGVSYMVSDDLSITPISTLSIVSMLNKFNVTKPEERIVKIGMVEALEVLKASLQSTTVLTDVFLNSTRKQPGNEERKICIGVRLLTGETIGFKVLPSWTIYILMARIEKIQGIPPKNQTLIFNRCRLRPSLTFADYDIVDGSVLFHMFHQRGC